MKIPRGAFIYITLFVVLSLPFILALLPQQFQATEFSIYNESWNGLSEFRSLFEETDDEIQIKSLIGSTNALNRVNGSSGTGAGTLVIMGPRVRYDPTEAIAILLYVAKGGRVLLADDFGSGNDILSFFSILLEAIANTPVEGGSNPFGFDAGAGGIGAQDDSGGFGSGFPIVGLAINQSVLIDTASNYKSPVQPVFTPAPTSGLSGTSYTVAAPWLSPLVENVDEVIGNYAATLSMKVKYPVNFTHVDDDEDIISINDWTTLPNCELTVSSDCQENYNPSVYEVLWVPMGEFPVELTAVQGIPLPDKYKFSMKLSALYSSQKSWLEANTTAAKNVDNISPDESEWGNIEFPIATSLPLGVGESAGSLTIISDPSIFINRYLKSERFEDCTEGFSITSACEADIDFDPTDFDNRQFALNLINMLIGDRSGSVVYFDEGHLAQSYMNPTLFMGTFFRFLDMMSMFPLLAPLLPLSVLGMARRYAPRGRVGTALLKTKVESFYGRSYFAYKMRWFLEYRHYTRGLELIYRRIRRDLTKRYKLHDWYPELAFSALQREYPSIRKNIQKKLEEIEKIIDEGFQIDEEQFMDLYLTLKEIQGFIK
ncbi:MAG: DUF4350 domain-containing protein [Candidatus Hodarchaeales archaeon]|jgi:hypothetical protein